MSKPYNIDIDWDFDLTTDSYLIRIRKIDRQGDRRGIIIRCPESALTQIYEGQEYNQASPNSFVWEQKRFELIEYKPDDQQQGSEEDIDRTG